MLDAVTSPWPGRGECIDPGGIVDPEASSRLTGMVSNHGSLNTEEFQHSTPLGESEIETEVVARHETEHHSNDAALLIRALFRRRKPGPLMTGSDSRKGDSRQRMMRPSLLRPSLHHFDGKTRQRLCRLSK